MISFNKKNRYVRIYSGIRHRMFKNFYQESSFCGVFLLFQALRTGRPPHKQASRQSPPLKRCDGRREFCARPQKATCIKLQINSLPQTAKKFVYTKEASPDRDASFSNSNGLRNYLAFLQPFLQALAQAVLVALRGSPA